MAFNCITNVCLQVRELSLANKKLITEASSEMPLWKCCPCLMHHLDLPLVMAMKVQMRTSLWSQVLLFPKQLHPRRLLWLLLQ